MIKEIQKPNINFKFLILPGDKFYFDSVEKVSFLISEEGWKHYFNLNGDFHRENGPTVNFISNKNYKVIWPYYLNNDNYHSKIFAIKTKHLICYSCNDFCKQKCFI